MSAPAYTLENLTQSQTRVIMSPRLRNADTASAGTQTASTLPPIRSPVKYSFPQSGDENGVAFQKSELVESIKKKKYYKKKPGTENVEVKEEVRVETVEPVRKKSHKKGAGATLRNTKPKNAVTTTINTLQTTGVILTSANAVRDKLG